MNNHVHPLFQAILAPYAAPPRDPRWLKVADAHQHGHEACESCTHNIVTTESGSEAGKWGTTAHSDCSLGLYAADTPSDCPAVTPTNATEVQL